MAKNKFSFLKNEDGVEKFCSLKFLENDESVAVLDVGGKLDYNYRDTLKNNGYLVKELTLIDPEAGNKYNPFHYFSDSNEVKNSIHMLIKASSGSAHNCDPFWEEQERILLSAMVLYLWNVYPEEQQTFDNINRLLCMAEVDENDASAESPLDLMFEDLRKAAPDNEAVILYRQFKTNSVKMQSNMIIRSLSVRLKSLFYAQYKNLTATDEMELDELSEKKMALFIIVPESYNNDELLVDLLEAQTKRIL